MAQERRTLGDCRTKVTLRTSLLGQIMIPVNPQHNSTAGCHEIQGTAWQFRQNQKLQGWRLTTLLNFDGFLGDTSHKTDHVGPRQLEEGLEFWKKGQGAGRES